MYSMTSFSREEPILPSRRSIYLYWTQDIFRPLIIRLLTRYTDSVPAKCNVFFDKTLSITYQYTWDGRHLFRFFEFFVYKVGFRKKQFLRSLSSLGPPGPELWASKVLTSALDLEFSNGHISFIFKDTYLVFSPIGRYY